MSLLDASFDVQQLDTVLNRTWYIVEAQRGGAAEHVRSFDRAEPAAAMAICLQRARAHLAAAWAIADEPEAWPGVVAELTLELTGADARAVGG